MAIDPLTEKLRSFADAAKLLPALRGGRPVSASSVWRWMRRGVLDRHGVRVRLETIRLGGTHCTSDEAIVRFVRALTDGANPSQEAQITPVAPPSPDDATGASTSAKP